MQLLLRVAELDRCGSKLLVGKEESDQRCADRGAFFYRQAYPFYHRVFFLKPSNFVLSPFYTRLQYVIALTFRGFKLIDLLAEGTILRFEVPKRGAPLHTATVYAVFIA